MASADFILEIHSIPGESKKDGFKDKIDLESWSWGATNIGTGATGGGHGAGKVSMQDFHFVKSIDKASPKIMLACAEGTHIPSAKLTCRKAGGKQEQFMIVKFTDVLISSYQTGGSGGSSVLPVDQCSFNFAKIEIEYKEQKADGSLGASTKAGFDLKTNKKV